MIHFVFDIQIVVTSTWKDVPRALEKLKAALAEKNIEYLGCTENLPFKSNRTHEINHWINIIAKKSENNFIISNWVAIDDIDLYKLNPKLITKDHFIHTNIQFGLTDNLAKECIDKLNN